jgi:hypothetical protein
MTSDVLTSTPPAPAAQTTRTARLPWWLYALAAYSLLLGLVTAIPQIYYVLFSFHLVPIGPHANPLGEVWYWYTYTGDNSYLKPDSGIFARAINDAFVLGPLYTATAVGLILRRGWVIPVGLITAGRSSTPSSTSSSANSILACHQSPT